MTPASRLSFRAAIVGLGCSAVPGTMSHVASARQAGGPAPTILTLTCQLSGGGYAIRDAGGNALEHGDGVRLSPPPRSVLRITAAPARVEVMAGVLPHPGCTAGPVLQGTHPVRFTWCEARYEIVPGDAGAYTMRSTSSTMMVSGPHRGDTMEAFMVGQCYPANQARLR